jgi:hypothetical protein
MRTNLLVAAAVSDRASSEDRTADVHGTSERTSGTRSLVLALAPVLVPEEREQRAPARNGLNDSVRPDVVHETSSSDVTVEATGRATTPDDLARLYRYWRAVSDRCAPAGSVRDPGEMAGRDRVLRALNHPELRKVSAERIEKALDVVGIQCEEKAKAGDADPWSLLASAWSPGVLVAALECPDEKTARQRAVRRSQGKPSPGSRPGVKTGPNASYRDRGIGECEI